MHNSDLKYYVLFKTYEQGLELHDLLDKAGILNRIAPAPKAIQGDLSCGVSLLINPEEIDAVRECIEENNAPYHAIVPLEGQLKSRRDKYC